MKELKSAFICILFTEEGTTPNNSSPNPVTYTLRPAKQADQPTIKQLIRTVGINPIGLKWQRFFVATDNQGNLIGCGQVKPHRDGSLELASIATNPAYRGQGIARAVITQLLIIYPPPLWLTCVCQLVPFYEKFGFVEVMTRHEMPPYFRRAQRLFNIFARITNRNVTLAVMVCRF